MPERRNYTRVSVAIPARLRCRGSKEFAGAQISDLSLVGCFLRVDRAPPLASHVEIEFDLEREPWTVRIEGKVVHALLDRRSYVSHRGIGIEFTHLRDEDVGFLWQIVQRHSDHASGHE